MLLPLLFYSKYNLKIIELHQSCGVKRNKRKSVSIDYIHLLCWFQRVDFLSIKTNALFCLNADRLREGLNEKPTASQNVI